MSDDRDALVFECNGTLSALSTFIFTSNRSGLTATCTSGSLTAHEGCVLFLKMHSRVNSDFYCIIYTPYLVVIWALEPRKRARVPTRQWLPGVAVLGAWHCRWADQTLNARNFMGCHRSQLLYHFVSVGLIWQNLKLVLPLFPTKISIKYTHNLVFIKFS